MANANGMANIYLQFNPLVQLLEAPTLGQCVDIGDIDASDAGGFLNSFFPFGETSNLRSRRSYMDTCSSISGKADLSL
jgi:hypothetical protein